MIDAPRGRYIGKLVGARPKDEAEHFIKCPTCGGWIDCRDLGQVFEPEGPLPHPAQDRRNDHEKAPLRGRASSMVFLDKGISRLFGEFFALSCLGAILFCLGRHSPSPRSSGR